MPKIWTRELTAHKTIESSKYVPIEAFEGKPTLIWADTGTGKTTAAIAAARKMIEDGVCARVFIALPSVAQVRQIEYEYPDLHCTYDKRAPFGTGPIAVGTFDKAHRHYADGGAVNTVLICDEIHKLQQAVSYREVAIGLLRSLDDGAPNAWQHVIGLSGTPQLSHQYFRRNVVRVKTPPFPTSYLQVHLKSESDALAIVAERVLTQLNGTAALIYLPSAARMAALESMLRTMRPELKITCISSSRARRNEDLVREVCGTREQPADWDVCIGTNYIEEGLSIYHSKYVGLYMYAPGHTRVDAIAIRQANARVRTNKHGWVCHFVRHVDNDLRLQFEETVYQDALQTATNRVEQINARPTARIGRVTDEGRFLRESTHWDGHRRSVCAEKIQQQTIQRRLDEGLMSSTEYAENVRAVFAGSPIAFGTESVDGASPEFTDALSEQMRRLDEFRERPLLDLLLSARELCADEMQRAVIEQEILAGSVFKDIVDLRDMVDGTERSPWSDNKTADEEERFACLREWASDPSVYELLRETTWSELRVLQSPRGQGLVDAVREQHRANSTQKPNRHKTMAANLIKSCRTIGDCRAALSRLNKPAREMDAVLSWIEFDRKTKHVQLADDAAIEKWFWMLPAFGGELNVRNALWKTTTQLCVFLTGRRNAVQNYLHSRGLLRMQVSAHAFVELGKCAPAPGALGEPVWLNREIAGQLLVRDSECVASEPWLQWGVNPNNERMEREAVAAWVRGETAFGGGNTPQHGGDGTNVILRAGAKLIGMYQSGALIASGDNISNALASTAQEIADLRAGVGINGHAVGTRIERFAFKPEELGLIVLDIDIKNGKNGLDALNELARRMDAEEFNPRKHSCIVRTPSGGYHLYFKAPKGKRFRSNVLCNGVDVFAANKRLTAPGSRKSGGEYVLYGALEDAPMLPAWIEGLLDVHDSWEPQVYERREPKTYERKRRADKTPMEICNAVLAKSRGYTGRNEACFAFASVLARAGLDMPTIMNTLREHPSTSGHANMRYTVRRACRLNGGL